MSNETAATISTPATAARYRPSSGCSTAPISLRVAQAHGGLAATRPASPPPPPPAPRSSPASQPPSAASLLAGLLVLPAPRRGPWRARCLRRCSTLRPGCSADRGHGSRRGRTRPARWPPHAARRR